MLTYWILHMPKGRWLLQVLQILNDMKAVVSRVTTSEVSSIVLTDGIYCKARLPLTLRREELQKGVRLA